MRKKKLLSLALSAAMAMAPMTVSVGAATPSATPFATTESGNSDAGTELKYSVSADVQAVSKNQYKVVLPTNQALKFAIDPQGLLSVTDPSKKTSLETLAAEAGLIRPAATSINAHIQNKSSMPVTVSVDMYMDQSKFATVTSKDNDAVLVTSRNDIGKDTKPNMLIAAVPSKVDTVGGTYAPVKEAIVLEKSQAAQVGKSKNYANRMEFYLDKAAWDVSKNGTSWNASYSSGGSGTTIALAGLVNTKADWSKIETIPYLEAIFWFDDASATNPTFDEEVGAYGLLSSNSSRTTEIVATLGANKNGLVKVLNGDGLKSADGRYVVDALYYVETSSKIDTSSGIPTKESLTAANATYAGEAVQNMTPDKYTWDDTTGQLQINPSIVNALQGLKDHLVFFFAFNDGTVLMSEDVGF